MSLHVEIAGPARAEGRRIVLAHGFTQNSRCWGAFGDRLVDALADGAADDHEVVAVDLPGHGATPSGHDDADLVAAGRLLLAAGGSAIYVGYSMGGRVALHAALADPAAVEGLVLIGATAGIDDPDERASRRAADEALADRLLAEGVDAFLDRWLANPLFAGLDERAAARSARLTNRPEGLAASLRRCGTGTQEPLWDRLGELGCPVLVVAGTDDAKFTRLGHRLVDSLPDARFVAVDGTHAVHLEQPETTATLIAHFARSL